MDAFGHSLENCWPLKYKTHNLIDVGLIHIDPPDSRDIRNHLIVQEMEEIVGQLLDTNIIIFTKDELIGDGTCLLNLCM